MKFIHAVFFVSALCGAAGLAAATPAKTTAKKSTAKVNSTAKTTKAGTAAKAPASKAPATSHVAAKGKKAAGPAAPRRQLTPTPDRYREIQQALINKGYLKGEPTGVWDADSVAAMQHFQSDQKETPTGKITAASLIGLGLGAKSAGAPEAPPVGATGAAAPGPPPPPTSAPAASQ